MTRTFVRGSLVVVAIAVGLFVMSRDRRPRFEAPVAPAQASSVSASGDASLQEAREAQHLEPADSRRSETVSHSTQTLPQLASVLRVELLPPSGQSLPDAQVSFFGPEEGQVVTVMSLPGQSIVELAIAPFLRIREQNKYVGYIEVQAPSIARFMRWITVDEASSAAVLNVKAELQPGHDLSVLVTDQSGAVASGAVVLANGQQETSQPGFVADRRVEAGPDGRCVIHGLAQGEWNIRAGQWKDWGASEPLSLRFGPGESPSADIVLVVMRWLPGEYSSGVLEIPDGWGPVYLEECAGVGGAISVYGNEFYARVAEFGVRDLRAVDEPGGRRSKCVQVGGGLHGLRLSLLPE